MTKKKIAPNPTSNKPVESKNFSTPEQSTGTKWVDERLNHERQLRFYKKVAFWLACFICIVLYVTFFIVLYLLFTNTLILQIMIIHKHLMTIVIALLLIPSAILWGIVRAVFKVSGPSNSSEVLKTISSAHPGIPII